MTPEEIANQTLNAAWISAGAAVFQAFGAVVAIGATVYLARKSEIRAAEAERVARERADAAEAASIVRAEKAEAVALQRSALRELDQRRGIARLVWSEAMKLIQAIEDERTRAFNGGIFNDYRILAEAKLFLTALALVQQKTDDFDLLEETAAIQTKVRNLLQDGEQTGRTPQGAAVWHGKQAVQIRDAIDRLKGVAAKPFMSV